MTAQRRGEKLASRRYGRKHDAKRAMWRYVSLLQRNGIHTGALRGDNGYTAQWVDNTGRTQYATVDSTDNYYIADREYYVRLSCVDND